MKYGAMKMYLDPDGGQGGGQGENGTGQQPQNQAPQAQSPAFDYEKLASLVAGKQTVTEDTVLKSYFKQQGLSQEEAEQAISAFKEEKAKNTPDIAALQNQVVQGRAQVQQAQLEKAALLAAISLGLEAKTIPYVLRMADLSVAQDKDGKINEESVKAAINKVMEDVPQLKPAAGEGKGFQIGGGQQNPQNKENRNQVPIKRWNRFNN